MSNFLMDLSKELRDWQQANIDRAEREVKNARDHELKKLQLTKSGGNKGTNKPMDYKPLIIASGIVATGLIGHALLKRGK